MPRGVPKARENGHTIDLRPNFAAVFTSFLAEARSAGKVIAKGDFGHVSPPLTDHDRIEITRRVQALVSTLNVAAQSITSVADVEAFREALADITVDIAQAADTPVQPNRRDKAT